MRRLLLLSAICVLPALMVGGCQRAVLPSKPAATFAATKPPSVCAWPTTPRVSEALGVVIFFTSPRPIDMRMLAATGFHWIRIDFTWASTERIKGRYDFSAYDHLLAALHRYHIRAMLILDYGNPLYPTHVNQNAPVTRLARHAFCRWVAAAVRHFQGQCVVWEMWNEPDCGFTWPTKNAALTYAKLALAVGKTIRRVAPQELYVGPALCGTHKVRNAASINFLRQCFQAGLLRYWDAVTVHPYRQGGPESVIANYRNLRALIARYAPKGKKIPIISGEWGYSAVWKGYNNACQARMLAREFLVNLSQGIPLSIWFQWGDGPDPKDPEHHFGLFHFEPGGNPAYSPKPDYLAARTLTTQLGRCRFVRRLKVGGPEDYVFLFAGPQERRIAAWTTSAKAHDVPLTVPVGRYLLTNETGAKTRTLVAPAGTLELRISHDPEYLARQ